MPLTVGTPTSPAGRLVFDRSGYNSTDVIGFRVLVEGVEPVVGEAVFTGTVTLPNGQHLTVSGAVPVHQTVVFGPFTGAGYTVTQDPSDPASYQAIPHPAVDPDGL